MTGRDGKTSALGRRAAGRLRRDAAAPEDLTRLGLGDFRSPVADTPPVSVAGPARGDLLRWSAAEGRRSGKPCASLRRPKVPPSVSCSVSCASECSDATATRVPSVVKAPDAAISTPPTTCSSSGGRAEACRPSAIPTRCRRRVSHSAQLAPPRPHRTSVHGRPHLRTHAPLTMLPLPVPV